MWSKAGLQNMDWCHRLGKSKTYFIFLFIYLLFLHFRDFIYFHTIC